RIRQRTPIRLVAFATPIEKRFIMTEGVTAAQSKLVLVTGATGKRGGACVEALLTRGHKVRALTRNSASPAANRLRERGVDIVLGDFSDRDSLMRCTRRRRCLCDEYTL